MDRLPYSRWQLKLPARREGHAAASLEERWGEAPAVHADESVRTEGGERRRVRLLEDLFEVAVRPDPADGERGDPLGRDVALRDERVALEQGGAWLREPDERRQRRNGIDVVRVDDQEVLAGRELLGRENRIRGPARFLLNREGHGEPPRRRRLCVVLADRGMLGTDHEAHLLEPGVGKRAQDIVEKRPAEGNHRLHAARGDLLLSGIQTSDPVRLPHARAKPPREHDRLTRPACHDSRGTQRRGTRRASQTPLRTNRAIQTPACAVLPYRTLPVPKSAA